MERAQALLIQLTERSPLLARLYALFELTKPEISFLVIMTAVTAFLLGSDRPLDFVRLGVATGGITLLSCGIATMNQYLERRLDGKMRRTERRPLPSGRLTAEVALLFGLTLSVAGEVILLFFVNGLTALVGAAAFVSYLFGYTPLKTKTTLCTAVGAIPGALPPVMGWTAARGELSLEAWVLFALLFLWQFPHFFAIAWLYREDYARAGIRMLPVVDPAGKVTGQQIVLYTGMLVGVSFLPVVMKMSGVIYLVAAIILGIYFLAVCIRAAITRSKWDARRAIHASVIYLQLLLLAMVLGRL
ncbi:MAG TPA: heme o synthase [Blastocatellia bacterium]|nr:heme o synthase [Blastocatellia bacterium]